MAATSATNLILRQLQHTFRRILLHSHLTYNYSWINKPPPLPPITLNLKETYLFGLAGRGVDERLTQQSHIPTGIFNFESLLVLT